MPKQKNILVAVLGSTPQILTETLWCLKKEKGIDIDEVFVITTKLGKRLICEGNRNIDLPPLLNGVFKKFCKEFALKTKFNEGNIRVIRDENGDELEDIRDDRQNEIAANFIVNEIRGIIKKKRNAILHCSVAGGRKTMSVYASLAMTLVGRKNDKLYHVLVSPPEIEGNPQFFYKPEKPTKIKLSRKEISTDEINITLAEVPFLRLGERYGNIFPDDITYTELVGRIQNYINIERPFVWGSGEERIEIIGEDEKFKKALRDLERYAENKSVRVVLLVGESGTGKELFAKRFHMVSGRKGKFEALNCAGISESLIESELFGYVKGAFTGALSDRKGIIEECDGGTLFLDEINKTTKSFQAKLLRFIEYGEIRPVGSTKTKKVDVRIVIALNQEPEEWLKSDAVLPDFYNRIMRHRVRIPPLRYRKDDIPILVEYFIEKYSKEYGKNIKGISKEVMDMILAYDWKLGNVRELEGVIADMVARADDNEKIITNPPDNLKLNVEAQDKVVEGYVREISSGRINLTLAEFEKKYIEYNLRKNSGNVTKTAQDLGLPRSTLQGKIKKFGISLAKYRH